MFERKAIEIGIAQIRGYLLPSPEERSAAYELLIEFTSRTVTAPLPPADGLIREALTSIYQLFGITRDVLRKHGLPAAKGSAGNLSLAVVAMRVLNEVFRPVLSSWHVELSAYEGRRATEAPTVDAVEWERRWPAARACRDDLVALRKQARAYAETLAQISGVPSLGDAAQSVPPSRLWEEASIPDSDATLGLSSAKTSKMVGWVSVGTLFRTFLAQRKAKQHGAAGLFDPTKDEAESHPYPVEPGEVFTFDYVADLGDGFDATAAIAWLLGRTSLELPDDPSHEFPSPPVSLARGRFLIMGGDQVYPFAAPGEYYDRVVVPYTVGWQGEKKDADVFAIPGNHDWYGGIEHFDAAFVSSASLGNWATLQQRRFWHLQLPQGWWLWAIDTHLHNTLSSDQVEYFKAAADKLNAGDRVIVCTPVPMWQLRQKDPDAYRRIRSVLEGPVRDRKATIRLWLSGDSHFFAHYENAERHGGEDHITSGGGGAFTSATHNLPERIPVERGNPEFTLTSRWPSATDSRALAMRLPRLRDGQFWLIAVIAGLLHWAFASAMSSWRIGSIDRWADTRWKALPVALRTVLTAPASWVAVVVCIVVGVAALTANSKEPRLRAGSRAWGAVVGSGLAATFLVVAAARRAIGTHAWWERPIAFAVGGWLSVVAFFGTLAWANRSVKAGDNLVLSPSGSTRFKHFVRFRIDQQGDLTAYVVGLDPVGQNWAGAIGIERTVPPLDSAGPPRLHYVWGKMFPKFSPSPIRVAISISEAPDVDDKLVSALYTAVCEALIDRGHRILYGGVLFELEDPASKLKTNFTTTLMRAAEERHANNPNVEPHLVNYVASYLGTGSASTGHLGVTVVGREESPDESSEHKQALDLSAMRIRQSDDADVRIVIGGRLEPMSSATRAAPGVLEEAYYTLERQKPLIVAGGFGGVSGVLADAVRGNLEPPRVDEIAGTYSVIPGVTSCSSMLRRFGSITQLRNRLTEGENRQLLASKDVEETLALILRSVDRIAAH